MRTRLMCLVSAGTPVRGICDEINGQKYLVVECPCNLQGPYLYIQLMGRVELDVWELLNRKPKLETENAYGCGGVV